MLPWGSKWVIRPSLMAGILRGVAGGPNLILVTITQGMAVVAGPMVGGVGGGVSLSPQVPSG